MPLVKPNYSLSKIGSISQIISKSINQNEVKYLKLLKNQQLGVIPDNHLEAVNFVLDYYNLHGNMPNETVFLDNPEFIDYFIKDTTENNLSYDYVNYVQAGVLKILSAKVTEAKNKNGTGNLADFDELQNFIKRSKPKLTEDKPIDVFDNNWDEMFDVNSNEALYTGIPLLDSATKGLRRGEVAMMVGDINSGKSFLMCFIAAANLVKGSNVLLVSGEMNKEDIVARTIGFISHVNPLVLRDKSDAVELASAKSKFTDTFNLLKKQGSKFVILEGEGFSASSLSNKIEEIEIQIGEKIDFVLVDGVYLMATDEGKRGSDWQVQAQIANEFAMTARDKKLRLIISSQFSRGNGGDITAGVSDIAKSISYGEVSTVIMSIVSDESVEATNPLDSTKQLPVKAMRIIKNRVGRVGDIKMIAWSFSDMRWYDYSGVCGADLLQEFADKP